MYPSINCNFISFVSVFFFVLFLSWKMLKTNFVFFFWFKSKWHFFIQKSLIIFFPNCKWSRRERLSRKFHRSQKIIFFLSFFFFGAVVPNCDLMCVCIFSVLRILQVWNAAEGFPKYLFRVLEQTFFSQFKITWLKVARLYQMSNNPIPKQSSSSWKQKFQSGVPMKMRDFTSIKLTRRN